MTAKLKRRQILHGGAALVTAALGGCKPEHTRHPKTPTEETIMDTSYTPAGKNIVTGKGVGDFNFLAGQWDIRHQRLKNGTQDEWQHFESSAAVHTVLSGMGSIEEPRNADGSDMGMAVRVWRPELKQWADHWTSAGNGVVGAPQFGHFIDGDGVFMSEEEIDGVTWQYRGVWDRITPNSCRWHRAVSSDGGQSWDWNWWMEWTRQS